MFHDMNAELYEDTCVIGERMESLCIMYSIKKLLWLEKFSVWHCSFCRAYECLWL